MNPWMRLSMNMGLLGMEAAGVIALRSAKLAQGGPEAALEAQRMVAEKMTAALAAQAELARGALTGSPQAGAARAVALYRRKVRANRRRLIRPA